MTLPLACVQNGRGKCLLKDRPVPCINNTPFVSADQCVCRKQNTVWQLKVNRNGEAREPRTGKCARAE